MFLAKLQEICEICIFFEKNPKKYKKIHQDDPSWSKMVPIFYMSFISHSYVHSYAIGHWSHWYFMFDFHVFFQKENGTFGASSRSCLQLSARAWPGPKHPSAHCAKHMCYTYLATFIYIYAFYIRCVSSDKSG